MPFGSIHLNDGTKIPAIAFGTGSTLKGTDVTQYVEQALENGFTHIDTASFYETEKYIKAAIREEGLDRSELYITTKYDGGPVRAALEKSLNELGLKQVDLYLIHFPTLVEGSIEAVWEEFEKLQGDGLTKYVMVVGNASKHRVAQWL